MNIKLFRNVKWVKTFSDVFRHHVFIVLYHSTVFPLSLFLSLFLIFSSIPSLQLHLSFSRCLLPAEVHVSICLGTRPFVILWICPNYFSVLSLFHPLYRIPNLSRIRSFRIRIQKPFPLLSDHFWLYLLLDNYIFSSFLFSGYFPKSGLVGSLSQTYILLLDKFLVRYSISLEPCVFTNWSPAKLRGWV